MPLEQLKQVTGYVRGGCSPIGMKHLFQLLLMFLPKFRQTIC